MDLIPGGVVCENNFYWVITNTPKYILPNPTLE